MTVWRDDPEHAADTLVLASLDAMALTAGSRLLLVNQGGALPQRLRADGFDVTIWNRRASPLATATAAPPLVSADAVLVRVPKSKDELEMTVHLACAAARPGARVFVYGGNDEGMRTIGKRLAGLSDANETVSTRQHGRVIVFVRPDDARLKPSLDAWRQMRGGWVSYPGLFAGGAVDAGTALLITHLPAQTGDVRVLDFGCGPGAIAAAVRARTADAVIDLVDNDAVALAAAAENVPSAEALLGFDLSVVQGRRYWLIVSNPPIHAGIRDDYSVLKQLVADGAKRLTAKGQMLLVVQKRVVLQPVLAAAFDDVAIAADDGRFLVWRCSRPKR